MVFASDLDLDEIEARVVGSLIEKSMTTPDSYPLSTNGVTTACNQKSARDPVMSVTSVEVDTAAMSLRQRGWTRTVRGGRTSKHRHILDEYLNMGEPQLALIGVLLLRGAQTVGELRQRTDRMHQFQSIEDLENTLMGMAGREVALVRRLERQPGQKEARWIHLLSSALDPDAGGTPAMPASNPTPESGGSQSVGAPVGVPPQAASDGAGAPAKTGVGPGGGSPPAAAAPSMPAPNPVAAPDARPVVRSASAPTEPRPGSRGSEEIRELRAELAELRRRFEALCASLGEDNI